MSLSGVAVLDTASKGIHAAFNQAFRFHFPTQLGESPKLVSFGFRERISHVCVAN